MKFLVYTVLALVGFAFFGILFDIYIINWLPDSIAYYTGFEQIIDSFHNFFSIFFGAFRSIGEFLALILERIQTVIDWIYGSIFG